jgi:hypothetical protein
MTVLVRTHTGESCSNMTEVRTLARTDHKANATVLVYTVDGLR